jgi:hypothetical protein
MTTPASFAPASAPTGTSASVKTYHNNLAAHLASLIRQVGISSKPSLDDLPDAPPNNRQHSDSSLDSNSKVSSGVTTESKQSASAYETAQSGAETKEASSETEDEVEVLGEVSQRHIDPSSPSSRNDLTARADVNPPHFSPCFQDHEISSAGPSRTSRSSRSSHASPRLKTKQSKQSLVEDPEVTREQEHRVAWETEGRKVWRKIPQGFELKLDKKKRSGSNESATSIVPSMHTGLSGAGPGTAMRADNFLLSSHPLDRMSSNNPTSVDLVSEASLPAPNSASSVSASLVKTSHKKTSSLQRRQERLELDDAPETSRGRHPTTASQEEQDAYAQKRAERLVKKEDRLRRKVENWWSGVQQQWQAACTTPPDIEPHIPSPGLASNQLRFLPVARLIPELSESPTLKLPPLTVIGDTRRNRLHLINERQHESDVDLLIRLAAVNKKHAANTYTRTTPMHSAPMSRSRSGDEREDPRVHSMNVTTSMSTPRAGSRTSFASVEF